MTEFLDFLLPRDLTIGIAGLIVAVSYFTSMITAAFGLGGGLAMLAVLANVLPPTAVIPVHGFVQLGNNIIRGSLNIAHVNWPVFAWFAAGAVAGGAAGITLVVTLSRPVLQLLLGGFVLYSVLGPRGLGHTLSGRGQILSGLVTTFATLFVGATGPLVAALLPRERMTRLEIVGTHGAMLAVQHGLKIVLFGLTSFAFAPWLPLLGVMFAVGILGNLTGRAVLKRVSDTAFKRIFNVLLVLLALRLILEAAWELMF